MNSEQTILGTASGLNLTGCYRYSFKRRNNIFTISAVVGSSLSAPVIEKEEKIKISEAYHPCFDFVEIGRGTAPAVVGSSLSAPVIEKEEK